MASFSSQVGIFLVLFSNTATAFSITWKIRCFSRYRRKDDRNVIDRSQPLKDILLELIGKSSESFSIRSHLFDHDHHPFSLTISKGDDVSHPALPCPVRHRSPRWLHHFLQVRAMNAIQNKTRYPLSLSLLPDPSRIDKNKTLPYIL